MSATLAVLLSGTRPTTITEGDEERPIVLKLAKEDRMSTEGLEKLRVLSPYTGEKVMLLWPGPDTPISLFVLAIGFSSAFNLGPKGLSAVA